MLPHLFSNPTILLQGLFTGLILGILLQKGRVTQFKVIVNQLLLKDFTVLKIMLTAIVVGSIGIYGLLALDLPLELHFKGGSLFAAIVGGIIFGTGMATLGYCPGTCVGAAGQGSRDGLWGMLGMLLGAFTYAELHEVVSKYIQSVGRTKVATLPELFNVSPWIIIGLLSAGAIVLFKMLGKMHKPIEPSPAPIQQKGEHPSQNEELSNI